jgi:hypothetical protein
LSSRGALAAPFTPTYYVVLGSTRFEERIVKLVERRVTRGKAGQPKRTAERMTQQTPG